MPDSDELGDPPDTPRVEGLDDEDDPDDDPEEVEQTDEEPALDEADVTDADSDFGPPFEGRSFGGEFVWADASTYTCKILRVRAGEKVLVSTRGRSDMVVMLTGGRAVLEVLEGDTIDRVEMLPAAPISIHPDREHRLLALTEVEMFTVYARLDPPS